MRALFFIFASILILISCSNEQEELNTAYSFYRVGMFEEVLKGGDAGNQYKGLIYEFGLSVDKNTDEAKRIYKTLRYKSLSNKRLFMLCFIYCPEELDRYYKKAKKDFNIVVAVYALEKHISGEDCLSHANESVCNLIHQYSKSSKNGDLYYEIGKGLYEMGMVHKTNIKDFEFAYYMLTKSASSGNKDAEKFLKNIPYKYSWIPNLN